MDQFFDFEEKNIYWTFPIFFFQFFFIWFEPIQTCACQNTRRLVFYFSELVPISNLLKFFVLQCDLRSFLCCKVEKKLNKQREDSWFLANTKRKEMKN